MTEWIEETLHADLRISLRAERTIHEINTGQHRLALIENGTFGRVLALDNVLQTTEADEFIYHEMLAHLPILAHGAARKVLIIGGGDGGMLEETLKHRTVEQVTLVEIDPTVVDLAKEHLRSICGEAFEDPRTSVVYADGAAFVAESPDSYDVIIVDSTDPIGPGEALFARTFYENCKTRLTPGGVLVTQNGVPFLQSEELVGTLKCLKALFADATCYLATVPSYVGGPMAFGWATDNRSLRAPTLATLEKRYAAAGIDTVYYAPAVHLAAFALPGYIAKMIA